MHLFLLNAFPFNRFLFTKAMRNKTMFVLKNILPEELFPLLPEELGWGSVMNSIAFSTFSGKRAGRSIGRGGTTGSDVLVLIGFCSTYARGYKVNVAHQMASSVEAAPEASQPSKIDVDTTVTILNMGVKFCYRIPTVDLRQVEVQIQNNNSSMTVIDACRPGSIRSSSSLLCAA